MRKLLVIVAVIASLLFVSILPASAIDDIGKQEWMKLSRQEKYTYVHGYAIGFLQALSLIGFVRDQDPTPSKDDKTSLYTECANCMGLPHATVARALDTIDSLYMSGNYDDISIGMLLFRGGILKQDSKAKELCPWVFKKKSNL